ncbi:hypothetical protein [[Kitasatospora] papulosa]|uniref:hypothetical protein n=1 Tax=[Kitasatospora] papulosa TaxID=1464011 RepID=UPI00367487C0
MNESSHPQPDQSQPPGWQPGFGYSHTSPPPNHPPQSPVPPGFVHAQGPQHAGASIGMPQRVRAARITLYLLSGLLIVLALAALALADAAQSSLDSYSGSSEFMPPDLGEAESAAAGQMALAVSALLWGIIYAVIALVLAGRFGKGGNALRIGTIVYGAWHCIVGTFSLGVTANSDFITMIMSSVVELAAGVLLIFFMAQKESVTWFSRPRP